MRKRLYLLCTLVLLPALLCPTDCLACFCGTPPPEESAKQVALIVRGRVIGITRNAATVYQQDGVPQSITVNRVDLAVDTTWKGAALPVMSFIASESRARSTCEYPFRLGGEYLVYASQPYGVRGYPAWPITTSCSWTRPVEQAGELFALLGPGTPVRNAVPTIGGLGTGPSIAAAQVGASGAYAGRPNALDYPAGRPAANFLEFGLWPLLVATDRTGRVYVVDARTESVRILVFSSSGQLLTTLDPSAGVGQERFYDIVGLAADRQGNIWVSDRTHWLRKFAPDGQELFRATDRPVTSNLDIPAVLAIDQDDNLYAADTLNARVVKLSPRGTVLAQWDTCEAASARVSCISGIAVADSGVLYLADSRRRVMQTRAADGGVIAEWGRLGDDSDPLGAAFALATNRFGDVYVAEGGLNRIRQFSSLGELKAEWSGAGSAPGQFNAPWSIATDQQGHLYVSDRFNYRIQVIPDTS